jgi:hypothetical protein
VSRGRVVERRAATVIARRRRDPWGDFERAAAIVVARLTCGEVLLQDDGSQHRMVDIALTHPDGRKAAVEVRTATAPEYAEMQRHLRDPKGQFPRHHSVPELGRIWALSVSPSTPLKDVVAQLGPILQNREARGDTFQTIAVLAELPAAERAKVADLEALGIVDISSAPANPGEGAIMLYEPSVKGTFPVAAIDLETGQWSQLEPRWEPLLTWIDGTLNSSAKSITEHREKLAATGCAERHLFVGVTDASPDAYLTLLQGTVLPTVAPALPHEVTHLWLMNCGADRCLVWFPDSGWVDPRTVWGEESAQVME